ncbi:MAG: DUF3300 domain-containing protein [Reyranella sp.]
MTEGIRPPVDSPRKDVTNRRGLLLLSVAAMIAASVPSHAQAPAEKKPFSPQELDQMLAPIALYDDALLSQVLMAATYPLEVVEASRWQQANPGLVGDAAVKAVADKTWDVSVKSLVAFPSILKQMNDHLDWTQKLGDALIGQQEDVAASIQRLRARAAAAGNLKTGPQVTVTTESQGSETIYAVQQTNPEVVYVPSYDPNTVYGTWPYPSYPPTYWPLGGALLRGLVWGAGIAAAGALFGGWRWGYGGGSYVNVNANRAVNIDRNFNRNNIGDGGRWRHEVNHRRGVAYRDPATRQQFGQVRPGADQRQQFRGQLERPAGGGPGGGPGAGRPGGPGGGPGGGVAQRPGGGGPGGNVQRPGGGPGGGGQRPGGGAAQRPGGAGGQTGRGGALSGVNRGGQVNREAQRGRMQQQRSGGPRAGGGGGRVGGGGGGRPGGGGGARGGGGRR